MAKKSRKNEEKEALTQYSLEEQKRLNIPQTGLVLSETDPLNGKKTYMFVPHLYSELQWVDKTKKTDLYYTRQEMVNQ